jgi:hypothetical protein
MSTTDELIHREIERDEAMVRRAIEQGGLPTETEVKEVYSNMMDAEVLLKSLTGRIEGIAISAGDDLPFDVSLEQLGVVAMLTSEVEGEIRVLTRLNERAKSLISQLIAIRSEQQYQAAALRG